MIGWRDTFSNNMGEKVNSLRKFGLSYIFFCKYYQKQATTVASSFVFE